MKRIILSLNLLKKADKYSNSTLLYFAYKEGACQYKYKIYLLKVKIKFKFLKNSTYLGISMKRVLVKVPVEYVYRVGFSEAMEYISKLSIIEIINFFPNTMTVLEKITFKKSDSVPNDLLGINGIKYIEVINSNQRLKEYTCILHLENHNTFSPYFSKYKMVVSHPILIMNNEMFIPYLSYGNYVKKVYEKVSQIIGDNYDIIKITEYSLNKENLYSFLTGRQLEIATLAASMGYFDNPKKVSTAKLAEMLDITPSAFTEHIRKIKQNIFNHLF